MCGIAGVYGAHITRETISAMTSSIKHRGPDGEGYFQKEDLTLLHTRLAILDVSDLAAQPMHSSDGLHTIVFNGEIYNHIELRKKYLNNISFKSDSDTETVLYLYKLKGKDMLFLLRGMFAFVIYDHQSKSLFGARDRMGIKPFLYYHKSNIFVFASELTALKASKLIENIDIEKKAIRQLFLYGSIQFPYTLLKNVFSLAPAHYFELNEEKLEIKPYWTFPESLNESISFNTALEQFKELYEESVKLRLLSDRKVGVFLSGGLDSVSLLAALNSMGKNIETFTIGFSDKHDKFFSEVEMAKSISNYFGFSNSSKIVNSTELSSDIKFFQDIIDQPSSDGFNTFLVSKESKSMLTVALSGLGGDELMMGYPRSVNLYNKHLSRLKLNSKLSDSLLINSLNTGVSSKYTSRILKYFGNPNNIKLHYWASRLINSPFYLNNILFEKELAYEIEEDIDDFYKFDTQNYKSNLFNMISYFDMRTYMMSQLLRDMDVASMAHGIEVRFPFIDHKLVEFLFSLPSSFKYNPNNLKKNNATGKMSYRASGVKHILARAYEDKLPMGFLDSNKQGFQLPIYEWFKNNNKERFVKNLSDLNLEKVNLKKSEIDCMIISVSKGVYTTNHYLLDMLSSNFLIKSN